MTSSLLKGICRCCLSEGKFKSMEYAPPPSCRQTYAEMLNDILGYPLYHTGEVQLICSTCSIKMSQAFSFFKQVQAAENTFRTRLQQKIKDEIKQEYLNADDTADLIKTEFLENNDNVPLQLDTATIRNDSPLILSHESESPPSNTFPSLCITENRNIVLAESNTKEKPDDYFYCKRCEERFPKGSYRCHIRLCSRTCHICKASLKSVNALLHHKARIHKQGFKCNICDHIFTSEKWLLQHQRKTHMNEKNVKCAHCEYEAFNKYILSRHLRAHYDIRLHECRTCKKKFKSTSAKTYHERIHTGEKRKVCQLCGEKFVQRASLKYHLEKHHPGDA